MVLRVLQFNCGNRNCISGGSCGWNENICVRFLTYALSKPVPATYALSKPVSSAFLNVSLPNIASLSPCLALLSAWELTFSQLHVQRYLVWRLFQAVTSRATGGVTKARPRVVKPARTDGKNRKNMGALTKTNVPRMMFVKSRHTASTHLAVLGAKVKKWTDLNPVQVVMRVCSC